MEIESKKRQLEETLSEPDPKKTRLDSEKSSPQLKKRTLKIIPPKEPTEKVGIAEVTEPRSTPTSPIKRQSSPSKSPKRAKSEESRPRSPQKSPQKSPVKKTEKELKLEEAKKTFEFQTVAKTLKKMQLLRDSEKVLDEIVEKRTEKVTESVIVNDSRLFDIKHPNNDLYLGHVVYTGAQSRAAHSNRAVDLELFLCPVFTEKNYYATIQVRIPAEFLTYRGNIAVRKSALWGTDIYTDDSDVVAMIIHSGHYRPVDAPDPLPQNPDVPSVNQAALVDSKQNATRTSSSISFLSEIATKVQPVIAQADLVNSSANVLTPDHDLHVTLRILPRLIKYTGSTRYGLDSKGWGASHDGESVRVEKVEKVERGSVRKSVKKGFSKKWFESAQGLKEVDRSFSFSLDGTARYY
jgi:hypothetical protein